MAGNVPNNEQHKFIFSGRRVFFTGMLIMLGLLVYVMVKDIHSMSSDNPSQGVALRITQKAPTSDVREIAVGFHVSGRIAQMFFPEHAEVKQGDILASLDKVPFEEALASARAQLQAIQDEYNKPVHLPTSNFNAIEAARANVETAQYTYDEAHTELERRRGLMISGQLDNVYNDDVQNEHDAELNLERNRRALAQQEDAAGANMNRDTNKAAVQVAQTNVAIAETNLADTQLLAPAAGIITSRVSKVGTIVPAESAVYALSVPGTAAFNQQ